MQEDVEADGEGFKRIGRYLKGRTRVTTTMGYDGGDSGIVVWTDTDYAGCKRTRKSTSGGVVMWGSHLIKSWSSTQSVVALSSGEAEYYGMVKGASVALGLQSVLKDFNIDCGITLKSDASAAIAISNRRGLGKVRHIEVCQLWLQDKVRRGDIKVVKVGTHDNVADALTKYVSQDSMAMHMRSTNQYITDGRHELAPAMEC